MRRSTLLLVLAFLYTTGHAQQVTKTAGASTQITNVPPGVNWSTQNPINVLPANYYQQVQFAEAMNKKILQIRVGTGVRSNTVVLTNFGFALPQNSIVGSVVATVYGRSQAEDSVVVYLVKKITAEGVTTLDTLNKKGGATIGFLPANTFTPLHFGEGSSLLNYWGVNLSPVTVNDANFGLAFWIKNIGGITNTTEIDSVSLMVTYSIPIVAPVTFVSWQASKISGGTELLWKVGTEEDVAQYEVEKSTDNATYTTIGAVVVNGKKEYRFVDVSPANDVSYYRLKILDKGGPFAYSKVLTVKGSERSLSLRVYPVPAQQWVTLQHEKATVIAKILVSDAEGRVVKQLVPVASSTETRISISDLKPGLYHLKFENGGARPETVKLLKM
jgi:hypothetical protein